MIPSLQSDAELNPSNEDPLVYDEYFLHSIITIEKSKEINPSKKENKLICYLKAMKHNQNFSR